VEVRRSKVEEGEEEEEEECLLARKVGGENLVDVQSSLGFVN
jgi:hypothetical protein